MGRDNTTKHALSTIYNDHEVETQAKAVRAVRWDLAAMLSTKVSEFLTQLPQDSYSERLAIAHIVNGICRDFGLAVIAPRGGYTSYLAVDVSGGRARFRFRQTSNGKGGKKKMESSVKLSQIQFSVEDAQTACRASFAGLGLER